MGIQDRDYWREWHKQREDPPGYRRRPPELPGADWHWSLKALAWLLIAMVVFALLRRFEPPPATPRPTATSPQVVAPKAAPPTRPASPAFSPPPAPAPQATYHAPAPTPERVTIYLCKDYNGGLFWSSAHCHQHRALIDRMESVPGNLPWDQKVQLAEQSYRRAAALSRPPPVVEHRTVTVQNTGNTTVCAALDQHIAYLDAVARQPQSAQTQDRIAAEKAEARSQQFRLRC